MISPRLDREHREGDALAVIGPIPGAQRRSPTWHWSRPTRYPVALLLGVSYACAPSVYAGSALSEPSRQPVDWRTLIPSIRRVLKQEFRDQVDIESNYQIRVLETADITGDGVPEAVVTLGVVGASSDCVTLMRLDGGRPRVARFRDWKGKVFTVVFPEGASAMHGQSVGLLPAQPAISFSTYTRDSLRPEEGVAACCESVFKWNAKTGTFDWNEALSEARARGKCKTRCQMTSE